MIILFAFAAITASQTHARSRDWRSIDSYEQFVSLVQKKVSEIPELAAIWRRSVPADVFRKQLYPKADSADVILFSGGRLRKLLIWIDKELSRHSYETVWKKPPPSLSELPSLRGITTDADLIVANWHVRAWTQQFLGIEDLDTHNWREQPSRTSKGIYWDLIRAENYHNVLVKAPGAAIQVLAISPNRIDDPHGALAEFYGKEMNFINVPRATWEAIQKEHWIMGASGYTFLTRVLAFIRYSYELDIPIGEKDWESFPQIIATDLRRKIPDYGELNKALSKLYYAMGRNGPLFRETLKRIGALEILERDRDLAISDSDGEGPQILISDLSDKLPCARSLKGRRPLN